MQKFENSFTETWAFLTVFHRPEIADEEGGSSIWAFADMQTTHEAESIIETIDGVAYSRRRVSEMSPADVSAMQRACDGVMHNAAQIKAALAGSPEMCG